MDDAFAHSDTYGEIAGLELAKRLPEILIADLRANIDAKLEEMRQEENE